MTIAARGILDELKGLPSADKLQIIEELWDSIPPDEIPIPDSALDEMDRRFEDYLRNPERAASWGDVESRVRKSLNS